MASQRSKTGWNAPKSGGYSAKVADSGRYVKTSTTGRHPQTAVTESNKPMPPKGRGAASTPTGTEVATHD